MQRYISGSCSTRSSPEQPQGLFLSNSFLDGWLSASPGAWNCSSSCRTLQLSLLNSMEFPSAYFSSLSRSLWMTLRHSVVSVTPHSFASSANVIRLHCSIIQIINEDIKQGWPQYWHLGNTTPGQLPAGFNMNLLPASVGLGFFLQWWWWGQAICTVSEFPCMSKLSQAWLLRSNWMCPSHGRQFASQ